MSLYVPRVFDNIPQPSVVYDNVRFGVDTTAIFRFADSRVGQFVEHRADLARAPLATRTPLVTPGTCWDRTTWLTDLSEPEATLTPEYTVGSWASPRLSWSVSASDTGPRQTRHRAATAALECALREVAETEDFAAPTMDGMPASAWNGATEAAFDAQMRERFIGNYASLAASLPADSGLAAIQSLRFPETREVPAGELIVEVDGVRYSATLSEATGFETAAADLDAAMDGPGHPRIGFQQYPDLDYRISVSTDITRPLAGSPSQPTSIGSRLRILRTPLAEALGFPIDQDALTSWIDPRNGDYEDRLMGCPAREPCVPQVDVDGDEQLDGTCGRVSECLEPGTPLLDHLFQGLQIRLGSPPVRGGQVGLCVPNGPDGALSGDVCAGPHASGRGSNRSYLSRVEDPGAGGTCSAGMSLATDVCMSCSDGVRDTADPGVSGVPRLCETDLDCQADLDCTGPTGCTYS